MSTQRVLGDGASGDPDHPSDVEEPPPVLQEPPTEHQPIPEKEHHDA